MFQRRIVLIKWKMGIWKQKLDVHSTEISLVRNCSSLPLPSQQTGIYEQLDAASVEGRKALIDCPVCFFLLQSLLSVFTEWTSKHTGIGQEWPAKEHRKRCSFLKGELFGVMRTTRTCDIRVSGSRAVPSLVERRMLSATRKAGGVKQAAVCSVAPPSFSSPVIAIGPKERQAGGLKSSWTRICLINPSIFRPLQSLCNPLCSYRKRDKYIVECFGKINENLLQNEYRGIGMTAERPALRLASLTWS